MSPLTGSQEERGGKRRTCAQRWRRNQVTEGQRPPEAVRSSSVLLEDGLELRITFCSPRILLADLIAISFYPTHPDPDFG